MLTSENIAVEQAGSQVVTVMGWGVQEFVLKSLRFWSWNTELAKTILGFRVHMGSVTDRDKDRVPSRDRGRLLGNSTLQNGSGLERWA